jgi:sigma-E factor negative regulatory protein RseC
MLETRAIVIRTEGSDAIVEAAHGGGCGACGGSQGCGSGKLAEALCVRPRQFRARNEIGAHAGDEVQVAVADGALLRGALTLYGLPLLLLFIGAISGAHWAGAGAARDAAAASGAAAGLLAGFGLAAILARLRRGAIPVIVRAGTSL